MTRTSIILTGLAGLVGAILLTFFCLYVITAGWIPVLINDSSLVWSIFGFLLFFSVLEIPVMIIGIRRIAASENPKSRYIALITNLGYTFFASVYAAPFILLAAQSTLELVAGALLGGLSFVRFLTSVIFLPHAQAN
jgi:hypothetical protein